MSFMSSEVLSLRATNTESNPVESKDIFPLPTPPATVAAVAATTPVLKHTADAIFAVVPFNTDHYGPYGKPNAIVRPVRRNESHEMILPPANEVNRPASTGQSTPKIANNPAKTNKKRKIDTFTKELDNKLRHLQPDHKISSKNVTLFLIWLRQFLCFVRKMQVLDCIILLLSIFPHIIFISNDSIDCVFCGSRAIDIVQSLRSVEWSYIFKNNRFSWNEFIDYFPMVRFVKCRARINYNDLTQVIFKPRSLFQQVLFLTRRFSNFFFNWPKLLRDVFNRFGAISLELVPNQ